MRARISAITAPPSVPNTNSLPLGDLDTMNARVFLTLIVLACAASPAFAQRAALTGTVTDQSGGVLSGVTITVVNADQGLKRNTTTNQQGHFAVPLLPPGSYTLAAQLAGFAPVEVQALVLNVGDVVTLNLKMEVGKLGETVMVQGEAVRASTSPRCPPSSTDSSSRTCR